MPIDDEVTLRKLEVFLQFMQDGHLGEVAEAVGRSPVAVHRSLHSLESGVGCPLFRKQGRQLLPLPAAHAFAEYARRAIQECEQGIARAQEVAGFRASRLVVGCAFSATVRTVPQLLQGLKTRRPQLEIDLKLGSTKELLAKLKVGDVDAAIVVVAGELDEDPDLLTTTLFTDDIAFAVPRGSRYGRCESIDLRDMAEEKFVALAEGFHTLKTQEDAFRKAGFEPHIVMRASNLFSLTHLVADGVGYGLLPGRVALFTTQVELVPLAAPYASHQRIMLFLPTARERDPNLLALAAECRMIRS